MLVLRSDLDYTLTLSKSFAMQGRERDEVDWSLGPLCAQSHGQSLKTI